MPVVSKEKKDKIAEQILHYLFTISPDSKFTSDVARELARDEEFTKSLMLDLSKKKLVVEINRNKLGVKYEKRQRWRLSNSAFDVYKRHQDLSKLNPNPNPSSELQQSL